MPSNNQQPPPTQSQQPPRRAVDTSAAEADQKAAAHAFASEVLDTTVPVGTKVTYGIGRKVSDGDYGSYDFHCSISLESNGNETPRQLVQKGIAFTEAVISTKVSQARKKKLGY